MAKKSKQSISWSEDFLNPFVFILPLLLLPPFFRGLFFDTESFIAYMYVSLVLIGYVLYKKDYSKISFNLMEGAFIGFVLAWFLAIFNAYDVREALGDSLRNLNYLIVFLLIAGAKFELLKLRLAMWTVFIAGVGVALAGIGTAYGTFWFNGAFVDGLINSTLQYHNAAAIYLMACGIVGVYLAASSEAPLTRYSVTGLNFLILITAFGAGSRGAMIMGPIAFAMYFVGIPSNIRSKSLLSTIAIFIPFALLSSKLLEFSNLTLPWLFLFVGIALASLIHYGTEEMARKFGSKVDSKRLTIGIATTLVVIGATLFVFSEQILPASLSERMHNFSFNQESVRERFYFYEDAMKIVKEHPILGTGGGGWNASYRQYQSYLYHSTEVHNHPLQVWVETGTVGFVFYLVLWLSGFVAIIRIMRSPALAENKAIAFTAFCVAVALGLHSLMDFTLSEGAVSLLLWSQFAIIRVVERDSVRSPVKTINLKPIFRTATGAIVALIFFTSSFILYLGDRYNAEAAKALNGGNIELGRANLEKAVKFDPTNAKFRVQLVQVYAYQAQQSQNSYQMNLAHQEIVKAIELNPTNSENYWLASQIALGLQKPDKMVSYAEKAVQMAPFVPTGYENLTLVYLNAGKIFLNNNEPEKAKAALDKVLTVGQEMEKRKAALTQEKLAFWKGPELAPTAKLKQFEDEATELLNRI